MTSVSLRSIQHDDMGKRFWYVLAFVVGIVSVLFIFILLYGYIGDERGIPPLDEASFPAPRLYCVCPL